MRRLATTGGGSTEVQAHDSLHRCFYTLLLLALLSCGDDPKQQAPPPRRASPQCVAAQRAIEAIEKVHLGWSTPVVAAGRDSHLLSSAEIAAASKPDQYFDALGYLSLENGYTLECVYQEDSSGGYPVLYARREGGTAFESVEQLTKALAGENTDIPKILENLKSWMVPLASPVERPGHPWKEWLDHVKVTCGDRGFLQLGILRIMADQFALFWHANYEALELKCHPEVMDGWLERWVVSNPFLKGEPDPRRVEVCEDARQLDLEPRVVMHEETVDVSLVLYTDYGGFIRRDMHFSKDFPHSLVREEQHILVPYDCGWMF